MGTDRVVVGGGLFGAYAAWVLGRRGHSVVLLEQDNALMQRATLVNQARLHSGLHYPRSMLTALESLRYYEAFAKEFPDAVREDFPQIYAISRSQSRTSAPAFLRFTERLGQSVESVDPDRWFKPGAVEIAVKVREGTFDAAILCAALKERLSGLPNVKVLLNTAVVAGSATREGVTLVSADGRTFDAERAIIATYAGINPLRRQLALAPLPLKHELAEVVLCRTGEKMRNLGITVMDGPFWSFMPFGHSDLVSVTSVSLTPIMTRGADPAFPCQGSERVACNPQQLGRCTDCSSRPSSLWLHHRQQLDRMLLDAPDFTYVRSMWTVKTVLSTSEVDDSRPTFIHHEVDVPISTIFSGKVSTVLELEDAFL